jgi:hypothetical protein
VIDRIVPGAFVTGRFPLPRRGQSVMLRDGMNVYRFLSRLLFLIAVGCFIAAGWLWWDARAA